MHKNLNIIGEINANTINDLNKDTMFVSLNKKENITIEIKISVWKYNDNSKEDVLEYFSIFKTWDRCSINEEFRTIDVYKIIR